ncbi:mechanosensitive ion channel family protein [Halovulum marinum]|nr:mechanosensitive ion channel domain-containing protein [Halovulum marinum]
MRPSFRIAVALLVPLALFRTLPVAAQGVSAPPARVEAAPDPWGRETPRGTVDGLLSAFGNNDMTAFAHLLDLSDIPEARRISESRRLGRTLERVLDRSGGLLPGYRLSADRAGLSGDNLGPDFDRFAAVLAEGTVTDLLLLRGEDEGRMVWRVAPVSLEVVRRLAPEVAQARYVTWLPARFSAMRIAGSSLAAWITLAALSVVALLIATVVFSALTWGLARLLHGGNHAATGRVIRDAWLPLALIGGGVLVQIGAFLLGIPVVARATLAPAIEIGTWLAIGWLLWRLVQTIGDEILLSMTRRERLGAVSVVSMARRFAKALVVALAAIFVSGSLGLDLTGWLAALGLGGLAFALGAQKTIEHLVGGLSIVADQPIRIGDFCQIDDVLGTVEDIGLRSTRIRTLDKTLVTIPNGDLSAARIENYAGRDRFRWLATIGLRYETTPDQMRAVIWRLDQLLAGDERIAEDHRARFVGFSASSLDIEILAYILASDFPSSLSIREELNLSVIEIVAECGASFAFPSTTVYIEPTHKPCSKMNSRKVSKPVTEA